eukprot:14711751-Alexandrium_andersonii.AAC.1
MQEGSAAPWPMRASAGENWPAGVADRWRSAVFARSHASQAELAGTGACTLAVMRSRQHACPC